MARAFREGITAYIGADVSGFKRGMGAMRSSLHQSRLQFTRYAKYAAIALIGVGVAASKMAQTFNRKLSEVKTILGEARDQIGYFREELIKLSEASGQNLIKLTEGLYQALSASARLMLKPAEMMELMAETAKFTRVGFVDLATGIRITTSILNAYGLTLDEITRIQNVVFRGVKEGVFRMDEFGRALPYVISVSKQFGIPLETLVAALTTMTQESFPVQKAARGLSVLLLGLMDPTSEMGRLIDELGLKYSLHQLRTDGLAKTMQRLAEDFARVNKEIKEGTRLPPSLPPELRPEAIEKARKKVRDLQITIKEEWLKGIEVREAEIRKLEKRIAARPTYGQAAMRERVKAFRAEITNIRESAAAAKAQGIDMAAMLKIRERMAEIDRIREKYERRVRHKGRVEMRVLDPRAIRRVKELQAEINKIGAAATKAGEREAGMEWLRNLKEAEKELAFLEEEQGRYFEKAKQEGLEIGLMFGGARSIAAGLILTNKEAKNFLETEKHMRAEGDDVADAMAEIEKEPWFQMQKALNAVSLQLRAIGQELTPIYIKLAELLQYVIVPALRDHLVPLMADFLGSLQKSSASWEEWMDPKGLKAQMKTLVAGRTWAEAEYVALSKTAKTRPTVKNIERAEQLGEKLKIARDIMIEMEAMERLGAKRPRRRAKLQAQLDELGLRLERPFPTKQPVIERLRMGPERALPRRGPEGELGRISEEVSIKMKELKTELGGIYEQTSPTIEALKSLATEIVNLRKAAMDPLAGPTVPGRRIRYQHGGRVPGAGLGDTTPALLTPGEFVVRRQATALWSPFLQAINQNPGDLGRIAGSPAGRDMVSSSATNTFVFNSPVDRHTIRGLIMPEGDRAERLKRTKGRRFTAPRRW